jgi:predicted dehydrogenase
MGSTAVGIVGCGAVSRMYLPILTRVSDVEVVAVADADPARAEQAARDFDVPHVLDLAELLGADEIDLVVNLTPIAAHVDVSKAALTAGKHVYSEKPLATSVQTARELVAEADRHGVALACAPDTLLGSGFEAARQALADGVVGRPVAATAVMVRGALTRASFYTEDATPIFDMAPYYLTALVNAFGPAVRVSGSTRTVPAGETPVTPDAGSSIAVAGVVDFASGLTADVTLVWASDHRREVASVSVYGSSGVLAFPNPNNFGDPAFSRPYDEETWTEIPGSRRPDGSTANLRGLGVAEMARSLRAGQPPRAGGEIACHVVEMIAGLVESARTGCRVEMTTTCTPAPPLSADERESLLGGRV